MADKPLPRSRLYWIAIGLIAVVFLAGWAFSSGMLSRDRKTLTIAAQGTDTLVTLEDRQVLLKGLHWPGQSLTRSIQVGGWTTSAGCPTPDIPIGSPGYVYLNYSYDSRSKGLATVTIGADTVTFADRGRSVLIDGTPTPLSSDQPTEVKAASDLRQASGRAR